MLLATAFLLTIGSLLVVLWVRNRDVPEPEPVSPVQHLEERRATIYENLRDLQFEYRVGKLSDEDYQQSKLGLQRELASVMAEIDRVLAPGGKAAPRPTEGKAEPLPRPTVCPHCGAKFGQALKFCGECGKPMMEARA